MDKKIDVLVLSGGAGTRVREKIGDTPKALMKHENDIALNIVLHPFFRPDDANLFNVNINIHKSESEYFKSLPYKLCIEETRIGNAGAIKNFCRTFSDPFIVVHNDINLTDIDIRKFYISHLQNDSMMTMVVKNISESDKERGIVIKKYNKVLGFTRERWTNCGVYCINRSIFNLINDGFQDIDNDLLPRLAAMHQLSCYEYGGFYEDWGR